MVIIMRMTETHAPLLQVRDRRVPPPQPPGKLPGAAALKWGWATFGMSRQLRWPHAGVGFHGAAGI